MSIIDIIKQQLDAHRIVLYMKGTPTFPQCGFSGKAVYLLKQCNADFHSINVLEDAEVREGIKQYGNWPTIPQLYINGNLIGGSDILEALFTSGELQKMVTQS